MLVFLILERNFIEYQEYHWIACELLANTEILIVIKNAVILVNIL